MKNIFGDSSDSAFIKAAGTGDHHAFEHIVDKRRGKV